MANNKVHFEDINRTFCSCFDGTAIGLPGYDKPVQFKGCYWKNKVEWIEIVEDGKVFNSPFKFEIDQSSLDVLTVCHFSSDKCYCNQS